MKSLTSIILANGIKSLMQENDLAFKKSLVNSLSLKLNESIKEVKTSFSNNILKEKNCPKESDNLKYFAEFVENYDSSTNSKLKLKNNTMININESEFKALKELFDALNLRNRSVFVETILESPQKLKQNLNFYREIKGKII